MYLTVFTDVLRSIHRCTAGYSQMYCRVFTDVPHSIHRCTAQYLQMYYTVFTDVPHSIYSCTTQYSQMYCRVFTDVLHSIHRCSAQYLQVNSTVNPFSLSVLSAEGASWYVRRKPLVFCLCVPLLSTSSTSSTLICHALHPVMSSMCTPVIL